MAEQRTLNPQVLGSNPRGRTRLASIRRDRRRAIGRRTIVHEDEQEVGHGDRAGGEARRSGRLRVPGP